MKFIIENLNFKNKLKIGERSFLIGVFFLPSALPISLIFLLISISISLSINRFLFFRDKYNQLLFICSGLMIFSCINSTLHLSEITNQTASNIFLGLANWLPLFILFYSSQIYLNNSEKRQIFSKVFISGSLPLLVSCILQSIFKIYGPFKTLNGLVVWFQEPIPLHLGVTGFFSNQNYTGLWLSIILVFLIYEIKSSKRNLQVKFIPAILLPLTAYFLILTDSRNALFGMLIGIFSFVKRKLLLIIPLFFSIFIVLNRIIFNNLGQNYMFFENLINDRLFDKLFAFDLANFLNYPRIEIYSLASKFILESPLLGWGPSTFPILFERDWITNNPGILEYPRFQHTHNITFELAYNFGIPLAIIMCLFIFKILNKALFITYQKSERNPEFLINKTWFVAVIIMLLSQINDVTYYDGKISILIWILLAGLKTLTEEKIPKKS